MDVKKKHKKIGFLTLLLLISVLIMVFVVERQAMKAGTDKKVITIAIVQDDRVQDYTTNYYTNWLEAQTNCSIEFEYIPHGYKKEYIKALLTAEPGKIDVVILPQDQSIVTNEEFLSYVSKGLIYSLNSLTHDKTNYYSILNHPGHPGLKESLLIDEQLYYFPNAKTSRTSKNFQTFWINVKWLKALGLEIPTTTKELYEVLKAFHDRDPNGNGIRDELPLVGCEADYALQSYNFLLNAFAYNDPVNLRFVKKDSVSIYSPTTDEFREGLKYCHKLYSENLLAEISFSFSQNQILETVCSPQDLVGAFASQSIVDNIYANAPSILSCYVQVPPLIGPNGYQNAIYTMPKPSIGAFIPANAKKPVEAFKVLDAMISEEGALIGAFGEYDVDWTFSLGEDLSLYGNKAEIVTLNYLKSKTQNKNYAGAGVRYVDATYIDGVAWNGDNSLVEFLDARAVKVYEPFYNRGLQEDIRYISAQVDEPVELARYTDEMITKFITGECDIYSKDQWKAFVERSNELMGG